DLRVLCGEFSEADLSRIPIFGFLLAMSETTISPLSQRVRGVLAPVVTPFKADLSPGRQRFIRHCQWLLSHNCGLAVFGTNSDASLRIYLYHIPPVAIVGITARLVDRLLKSYPNAIAGMKDSSGDWKNTKTFLDAFAKDGFDVFVGSESFLLANMRNGVVGTIS